MGAWGMGILENDSTVDYMIYIHTLLELGFSQNQIRSMLQKEYFPQGDTLSGDDIYQFTELWAAIAFAEWFYDRPSEEAIRKIEKIIKKNENDSLSLWADPDERKNSILTLFDALKKPREGNEKVPWRIWFLESKTDITDNQYSRQISWEYELMYRFKIGNITDVLLEKYSPLTMDLEAPIFWGTIGKCEAMFGGIKEPTVEKIRRIEKNPNAMKVIEIAYDADRCNKFMESLNKIRRGK